MGFPKSLGFGKHGEGFVQQVFEKAGIECSLNDCKETRQEFDLICKTGRTKFTCEVKFDIMSEKTGNLAIEYFNPKKDMPSGLHATKANIWAHIILDGDNKTLWITSVDKLKEYCKNTKPKRIVKAGGDKNADLMLFSCDSILEHVFHRAENIEGKDLVKIVKELLKYEKVNNKPISDVSASG